MSTVAKHGWESHLDESVFWARACGGRSSVKAHLGLHVWLLELLYEKYCVPYDVSRLTLYYVLVWCKHYPHDALLRRYHPYHLPKIGACAARNHVRRGLRHLSAVMREVDTIHLRHRNNSVPHFPGSQGSWDTFPIRIRISRQ